MNVSQSAHTCAQGERERGRPSAASRGSIRRLGLDGLDVGVGAVRGRLVLGLERRRLAARGARAREDEERLGDELCEGGGAVRRAILAFLAAEFPAFPRAFRDDRR